MIIARIQMDTTTPKTRYGCFGELTDFLQEQGLFVMNLGYILQVVALGTITLTVLA